MSKRSKAQSHHGGRSPKYLFSGLLRCGVCGARFVMRNQDYYGCSYHLYRGETICTNSLGVRRRVVENRLLQTIRQELFTPETVVYITRRVNEGLKLEARERRQAVSDRRRVKDKLREVLGELDHIKEAIRRGLLCDLTRGLLVEADARMRHLRAQLDAFSQTTPHVLQTLPQAVQKRLSELDRLLQQDVDQARTALHKVFGDIVLRPTAEGLVAELQGNIQGLLTLGEQAPMSITVVAGGRFFSYQVARNSSHEPSCCFAWQRLSGQSGARRLKSIAGHGMAGPGKVALLQPL